MRSHPSAGYCSARHTKYRITLAWHTPPLVNGRITKHGKDIHRGFHSVMPEEPFLRAMCVDSIALPIRYAINKGGRVGISRRAETPKRAYVFIVSTSQPSVLSKYYPFFSPFSPLSDANPNRPDRQTTTLRLHRKRDRTRAMSSSSSSSTIPIVPTRPAATVAAVGRVPAPRSIRTGRTASINRPATAPAWTGTCSSRVVRTCRCTANSAARRRPIRSRPAPTSATA